MSNILLLMADEHNPLYSSAYGHPFVQTPNMEKLAKRGTVFRNAYCPSPLCFPSRSSFISGKRVHELQTYNNCSLHLPQHPLTYGRVLSDQGVHTVMVGNGDVYDQPENTGFMETYLIRPKKKPGHAVEQRVPLEVKQGAGKRADEYGIRDDAFKSDEARVDAAIQWLKTKSVSLDCPWVLKVNLSNPHFPMFTTAEFWSLYEELEDLLPRHGKECETAQHPYARDLRTYFQTDSFTDEQIKGLRRGYFSKISFVDQQLGRLMQTVEETGLLHNTNIIYMADHGEMAGKFGMWWKSSLYDDSIRIPCIAAGPDFAAGEIVETPIDSHDVQASIFQSTGTKRPEHWVGTPLQLIPDNHKDRIVFSEYHGHGTRSSAYMIRKGDWKLIYYTQADHQLFHLADDPDELHNVYGEYPHIVEDLESELHKICSPELESERADHFMQEQAKAVHEYQGGRNHDKQA